MKQFFRSTILWYLQVLARVKVRRLKPFVIGVTGSVGKTSTKDAIYTVLSSKYQVIRNEKSFNSEFGLPLAILEQPSGFSSAKDWLKIIFASFGEAVSGGKSLSMMALEFGVDKPGDMDELLKVVQPQVAVMTAIKPVHLAEGQFKDLDDIFAEKSKIARSLPEKGTAILNADDGYILGLRDQLKSRILWYGTSEMAQLRASEVHSDLKGLHFTVHYGGEAVKATFKLVGNFQIYVILPAIATALVCGFSLQEAVDGLKDFELPPGRMSLLEGIHGTHIIDSTYNASPAAVKEALTFLKELGDAKIGPGGVRLQGRKIAVLGNMNELGHMTDYYHQEVGKEVIGVADLLFTVGESAALIGQSAIENGFHKEAVIHSVDAVEAAKKLLPLVKEGDIILVKGSQNKVRLEKLVKELLAHPDDAEEKLVRQDKHWKDIA